ncbi:MAG: GspE/PulE family protein [Candidatus Polarisedimenticolaceae bacterium]|nr:GspE/PulE family protein [Candidatus Polarisedimenticolaceae bacterium]
MSGEKKPVRIGDLLIEKGLISQDQLRIALIEQKKQNKPVGKILIQLGFVSESMMRDVLSSQLDQESVDLSKVVPDPEAIALVPDEIARRYNILPITYDNEEKILTVAMADTFNIVALDQTAALLGGDLEIKPLLTGEAEIVEAIDQFYGFELSIEGILHELDTGEIDVHSLQEGSDEYSQPLVRLVDVLLADAVKLGASDIHFEPEESFLRIRYRIDGVLRQIQTLHKKYWSGILVRLKVMSDMDIAETRAPQDGRISLTLTGRAIDFRVAAQPTIHGENIVLRVLDREKGIVPLDQLDMTEENHALLKLMMARPEGIILVTGPTGSGKTTTLYSMLNYLNDESVNIMTLEDPVEYPMAMIRQSAVNEAVKLDFANGIRSMMRQDPDIILVGEVRDEDTAEMAFRAAMTGHQVYTTLHTNSALGAVPRLLDIGIKPDIMAGNIIGVVAQRLIRRLCPDCKQAVEAAELERTLMGIEAEEPPVTIYHAQGCGKCNNQGYKGRMALMEVLRMDRKMDELISRRALMSELLEMSQSSGFQTLADDGVRNVLMGKTSLDEVSRVIDLTDRVVG